MIIIQYYIVWNFWVDWTITRSSLPSRSRRLFHETLPPVITRRNIFLCHTNNLASNIYSPRKYKPHHHLFPLIPTLYTFMFWSIWSVPPICSYCIECMITFGQGTDILFSTREYRLTSFTGFNPCTLDATVMALLSVISNQNYVIFFAFCKINCSSFLLTALLRIRWGQVKVLLYQSRTSIPRRHDFFQEEGG